MIDAQPDKGKCPYCGKKKRGGLRAHIAKRHPDGKAGPKYVPPMRVSKSQEKKFDDSDPLKCRFCDKRKRNVAAVQKHENRRHYEESQGLPPKEKTQGIRYKFDKETTPGVFRLSIFLFVQSEEGREAAKSLYAKQRDALAKLFGDAYRYTELEDTHRLDPIEEVRLLDILHGPEVTEAPVEVPEDAPLDDDLLDEDGNPISQD